MPVTITPEIDKAYAAYLDTAIDFDFHGKPILRRSTYPYIGNDFVDIVCFAYGYQTASTQLTQWTSVDDRLPDDYTPVMVFAPGWGRGIAEINREQGPSIWHSEMMIFTPSITPTHWQPLSPEPAPPPLLPFKFPL